MSGNTRSLSRRRFVERGVVGIGALAVGGILTPEFARAADLPPVDENDAAAKALKYAHDATSVDAATRGGADRICETCQLYTGNPGSEWGPCSIFPAKVVSARGWCTAWVKKSG